MGFENLKRKRERERDKKLLIFRIRKSSEKTNWQERSQSWTGGNNRYSNNTEREEQIEHLQKGKLESTSRESKI